MIDGVSDLILEEACGFSVVFGGGEDCFDGVLQGGDGLVEGLKIEERELIGDDELL